MMVVRKDGERIKISFPYNPDDIAKIKNIEGYRWHPEGRYWSVPYSEIEKFLSVFGGENLVIDTAIYLDELKKELMLIKYSQRTIKLYLYQNREFLEFSKKNPSEVSNADIKRKTLRRMSWFILSGIVLLHIYWKAVQTCGISKSCWGIKVQRRQRYKLM